MNTIGLIACTCPNCGTKDNTGLPEEVKTGSVHCGYCGHDFQATRQSTYRQRRACRHKWHLMLQGYDKQRQAGWRYCCSLCGSFSR